MYRCRECGKEAILGWAPYTHQDVIVGGAQVPIQCSNPVCVYSDPVATASVLGWATYHARS